MGDVRALATALALEGRAGPTTSNALFQAVLSPTSDRLRDRDVIAFKDVAKPEEVLGESVYRSHPVDGKVPGRVEALRGAVLLRSPNLESPITVLNLIEVSFNQFEPGRTRNDAGRRMPELEPSDAGAPVATWDGKLIGMVVGGAGNTGYVAPLADYLTNHDLQLEVQSLTEPELVSLEVGDGGFAVEDGLDAVFGELGREPSLDLGDIPEPT